MHCCTKRDGKELDLSKTYSKLLTNLSYVAVTFMPYLLGAHTPRNTPYVKQSVYKNKNKNKE